METETLLAGRYRLGPRVGSGGMADVHRATDELLGRDVAVKLLRGGATTQVDRERFAGEARLVAALNHPGIVTMLDAGLTGDRPFLVMELVEGPTLAQLLLDGPLDPDRTRVIGLDIASALDCAHRQGVVHRDVKPGNVLLRADGSACLADFGIARMTDGTAASTATGMVVGSPAYVAPEQVAAEEVGPPADVYSLGLVLLEALTGRRAFSGTGVEVAYARMHAAPAIPVSLGPVWAGALAAMTARSPQDRPAAAEVGRLLSGARDVSEVLTSPFVAGVARRRPRAAWAALGVTTALVAMLVLVGLLAGGTDRAPAVPTGAGPTTASTSPVARQSPTAAARNRTPRGAVVTPRRTTAAPHHAKHGVRKKPGKSHGRHGHR